MGKEGPRSQDDFSGKYLDFLARVIRSKKADALVDGLLTITEDQFLRIRPAQPAERQCLQEAVAKTLPLVPLEIQSRILFAGEHPLFKRSALTLYSQRPSLDTMEARGIVSVHSVGTPFSLPSWRPAEQVLG
jgi:hypothetical protein